MFLFYFTDHKRLENVVSHKLLLFLIVFNFVENN